MSRSGLTLKASFTGMIALVIGIVAGEMLHKIAPDSDFYTRTLILTLNGFAMICIFICVMTIMGAGPEHFFHLEQRAKRCSRLEQTIAELERQIRKLEIERDSLRGSDAFLRQRLKLFIEQLRMVEYIEENKDKIGPMTPGEWIILRCAELRVKERLYDLRVARGERELAGAQGESGGASTPTT